MGNSKLIDPLPEGGKKKFERKLSWDEMNQTVIISDFVPILSPPIQLSNSFFPPSGRPSSPPLLQILCKTSCQQLSFSLANFSTSRLTLLKLDIME